MISESPSSPRAVGVAAVLLAALLGLLALRMTGSEELRQTISQRFAWQATPPADRPLIVGPAVTAAFGGALFLLAGAAAAVSARSLTRRRLAQFLVIAGILAWGLISTFHAQNRFSSVVGLADVAAALLAGWTLAVLLEFPQWNRTHIQRIVIAAIVAILAIWVAKGFLQKFVEYPETEAFFRENPEQALAAQGIADPVQQKLFISRLKSAEVRGYLFHSNVFAAGMIGMLTLSSATLAAWLQHRRSSSPPLPSARASQPAQGEIPLDTLCAMGLFVLTFAGIAALYWTNSTGGIALGIGAPAAVFAGAYFWKPLVAWRRPLLTLAICAAIAGTAGILIYGTSRDALPSKSLLFRWHYWTASATIVKDHALWGVGLNNFGDYYLQFKRPSSPEDVKDPHNLFVRFASEMGLPAPIAVGGLALWMLLGAFRKADPAVPTTLATPPRNAMVVAGAVAALWVVGHLLFFELPLEFNIYISVLWAILAIAAFFAAITILAPSTASESSWPAGRYLAIAAACGVVAMGIYDQINIALVTGPVAMLFWMFLALSDARPHLPAPRNRNILPAAAVAIASAAAGIALLAGLWMPVVRGNHPWDPSPHEDAYVRAIRENRIADARIALGRAQALAPRSLELKLQEIGLLSRFYPAEPRAQKIRDAAALDHANARIARDLALAESDLPPAERAALLQEALRRDAALPSDEPKRLSAEERRQIQEKLAQLAG